MDVWTATQISWLIVLVIMLLLFVGIGVWITGRPLGILIDSRRRISLSRFQLITWSWLILSAIFAVAIANQTSNIVIAPDIWALMGISLGSTAGAIIIKGTQAAKQPKGKKTPMGLLYRESDSKKAALSDMFKGEEITDYNYVDITKVQMFFFTVAILLSYAWTLWSVFGTLRGQTPLSKIDFPELSDGLVVLIGISHAGYLTAKAAPKTPTA